jgi:hypothetical protein
MSDAYSGPATIVQGESSAEVQCEYLVWQESGLSSWRGAYAGAEIAAEPQTGEAELKLPDGRSATILISRMFHGTGNGEFTGNGAPPG